MILNLVCVTGGCDSNKFLKPLFEGQLAEEHLSPTAGGLSEHNHLPGLDFAVHTLLSHGDRLLPLGENPQLQVFFRL